MLQCPSQSVHISQLCNYGDREKEGIERKRERYDSCSWITMYSQDPISKQTNNNDLFAEILQGKV